MRQRAVAVHHERATVEYELVLSAYLVQVGERQVRFGSPLARKLEALIELLHLEWRSVWHQKQRGAPPGKMTGDGREPDVLADRQTESYSADLNRFGQRTWCEYALLVEDSVVRQLVLQPDVRPAVVDDGDGIVEIPVLSPRQPDGERRRRRAALVFELPERVRRRLHEGWTQHEIFGRISHERELGKDHEVGAECGRRVAGAPQQRGVAGEVADFGIELSERDGEGQC